MYRAIMLPRQGLFQSLKQEEIAPGQVWWIERVWKNFNLFLLQKVSYNGGPMSRSIVMKQLYILQTSLWSPINKILFHLFKYTPFIKQPSYWASLWNHNLHYWSIWREKNSVHNFLLALKTFGHARTFCIFCLPYFIVNFPLQLEKVHPCFITSYKSIEHIFSLIFWMFCFVIAEPFLQHLCESLTDSWPHLNFGIYLATVVYDNSLCP